MDLSVSTNPEESNQALERTPKAFGVAQLVLVRSMKRIVPVVLMSLVISVAASPVVPHAGDPAIDGKDQLLSEADFRALLAVARAHLAKFRPQPSIFRVTVVSTTEVHAWYHVSPQTDEDYADWLIHKRGNNQWRVTGTGGYQVIDLTIRSSQPLAVSITRFHMTSTFRPAAKLAFASGG